MQPNTAKATLAFLAFYIASCNAQCPSGQLGVGVNQECDENVPSGSQCSETIGVVWDSGCNSLSDSGTTSGFCAGGFGNGYTVDCTGGSSDPEAGAVTSVTAPDGTVYFGCTAQSNLECDSLADSFNQIYFCCETF